jgi:hypothetical protein
MASSITLDVTPGSIQVEFTITLPAAASSASSLSSAASVVEAINAADASTLTAALGVTILSTSSCRSIQRSHSLLSPCTAARHRS